jgi:hypothetical protein
LINDLFRKNLEEMKNKIKESIERVAASLATCIVLVVIVSYGANLICQWNFYNTYIDNGFPPGLGGQSLVDFMFADIGHGNYSIRFNSSTEPHFMKASVSYTPMPKISDADGLAHDEFYSLRPRPYDLIPYLQKRYPADLTSLSKGEDLSYFHSAIGRQDFIEHRYMIRNNQTKINFFVIESPYTGT